MFLEIVAESNTPLFIVAGIALVLMIIGMKNGQRIFNLFSIPAFIYLGVYYSESVPLILMFVALIIWNIYYAFWGAYE
jgi:hypothetical protein